MTEDQDLLAKISQLAGQINRHKNQSSYPESAHSSGPHSGQYVSRPPSRAERPGWAPYRGRPHARRPMAPHRHRTLILNNSAASGNAQNSTSSPGPSSDNDAEFRGTPSGWVAKRDRHVQLINSAIYDRDAQARTKAMEETRLLKSQKKAQAEENKVLRYAQGLGKPYPPTSVASHPSATPSANYQIFFNDVPFRIAQGGSKLIRQSSAIPIGISLNLGTGLPLIGDPNTANITPKKVKVAGVTFVRSKNGNLHRLGAVTSKRKPMAVKKKNELCKRFTTTGACYKGPSCLYIHDPNKVAICKDFLQTGKCNAGLSCDLSHEPSPHRTPACMHFLRGRCSNPECRYAHVRVTPGAPVCRDFATLGYCDKGAECQDRHVHECPDYASSGVCNKKRCRLPHVDRAGQIRKNIAKAESPDENDSDASSEEEEHEQIDSDDVDSDELDEEPEFIEGGDSSELSQQQDYIRF